ncbi:hypothetical protein MBAV_003936, partial [Candidatus Magnetobacterium bavaricum]
MVINLAGFSHDRDLSVLLSLLSERGYNLRVRGYFTDDTFVSDVDLPSGVVALIAETFAAKDNA